MSRRGRDGGRGEIAPHLVALTPARVRLDASGGPAPLSAILDFQLSHARARDAIHSGVDWEGLAGALAPHEVLRLRSRADDRATYIRRPDLGRRLDPEDAARIAPAPCDCVIVIADGLSARAIDRHAAPLARHIFAAMPGRGVGPIALVRQARVAIGDEIGQLIGAKLSLVLIGERPGLSVSDSVGAYLTWGPSPGTPDSRRNCVSNIHDNGGLSYGEAAARIAWLVEAAFGSGATGIALKDNSPVAAARISDSPRE